MRGTLRKGEGASAGPRPGQDRCVCAGPAHGPPGPATRGRRTPTPHLPRRGRHQPCCAAGRGRRRRVTGAAAPGAGGSRRCHRRLPLSWAGGGGPAVGRYRDRAGAGAAPPLLLRGGAGPANWGNPFVRSDGGSRGEAGRERGRRRHERALSERARERAAPGPAPTGAAGGRAGAAPLSGTGRCLRRLRPPRSGGSCRNWGAWVPGERGRPPAAPAGQAPGISRRRRRRAGLRPRSPARLGRRAGERRRGGAGGAKPWSGRAGWGAQRGVVRQVRRPRRGSAAAPEKRSVAGRGRGLAGQSSVTNRPRRRLLLPHPCHGRGQSWRQGGSETVLGLSPPESGAWWGFVGRFGR